MNRVDEDRDAWLAQALRHAPDANADAPPALSDMILREARAAARPAPPPARSESAGPLQWLASVWSWLARPPVTAGFASLMVATLVGVMWWGQPLDQSLPRAPEVVSSTAPARAEAAPPATVATAPAAPEVQATPAESAAPKLADASRATTAPGRLADKKEAQESARASRPVAERTRMLGATEAPPAVAAAAPPPAAFPAASPVPAPAPQAAATANEVASADRERLERAAPAAKAMAESVARAAADQAVAQQRNDARALQGAASPALAKARSANAGETPLATLRAQIAQQPERWRWQRDAGAPQPMTPAVQGWLAQLERQTASRWQAGAGITPGATNSLRLFRDGALQLTLSFSGSTVWAETLGASAAPALLAALPEGAAESLRKALEEATP